MASRPIKRERFALLDNLGINSLCQLYVEGMSVKALCEFVFDWSKHGKPGVNILYKWIDERGFRHVWDFAVRYKRKLHKEALSQVELEVPDIDWQREAVFASLSAREN